MAKQHKKTKAEELAKNVDLSNIDNMSVSDFATKDASALEQEDNEQTIDNPDAVKEESPASKKKSGVVSAIKGRFNIYLSLFIVVVIITFVLIFVVNRLNGEEQQGKKIDFEGTSLDQDTLNKLLANDSNVGTVDQTLTVAANAVFNGKILVKDNLDVAGSINVGGSLNLPGISVAGDSAFGNVTIDNNLAINGSATIEQDLSVLQDINVSRNLSVGGTFSASTINADNIVFSADITLPRHIKTTGSTPSLTRGSAVGSGGTATISGNDISGTITINTGGSPPSGILARITFVNAYGSTPNIQITPIGSSSAVLSFYADRDNGSFSIGTVSAPNGSTTYVFDYFISE